MSLTGTYDPNNVFAKMLRGEIPCRKVFEDEVALAFLDLFPQSPGHTLVIPKAQARNFLELDPSLVGPYLGRVHSVARAVRDALEPEGLIVTQFNGAPAGQTVFHLHFHLIPRWSDRPMAGHGLAKQGDAAEMDAIAAKIRAAV